MLEKEIMGFFGDEKIEKVVLPFSESMMSRVANIFNIQSNFFQKLIHYRHNNFEITVYLEKIRRSRAVSLESLGRKGIENLFVQFMAAFKFAHEFDFDFIDFEKFCLEKDNRIKFPVVFEKNVRPDIGQVVEIFSGNRHLQHLKPANCDEIFLEMAGRYPFDDEEFYAYRYEDFASNMLNFYDFGEAGNRSGVKINIKTENHIQKAIIVSSLQQNLISEDILLLNLAGHSSPVPEAIYRHVLKTESSANDFIRIVHELEIYLQKSAFNAFILILDNLKTGPEIEFIKYLMDYSQIPSLFLLIFGDYDQLEFDLVLSEKPENLLGKYLNHFGGTQFVEANVEEIEMLKRLMAISIPIPEKELSGWFTGKEVSIIRSLLKKKFLVSDQTGVSPNHSRLPANLKPNEAEEIEILKGFAKSKNSLFLRLKYLIKIKDMAALEELIPDQIAAGHDKNFDEMKWLLLRNLTVFAGSPELLEFFTVMLIKQRDLNAARKIILEFRENNPVFYDLKLAEIHKLEKDYQSLNLLLKNVEKNITAEYRDEFYYLKFVYFEKVSDFGTADACFKKIKKDPFLSFAGITLSDRFIYNGDFDRAEALLSGVLDYFEEHRFLAYAIQTRSQLAKLFRERGEFGRAENLYKTIYMKSEIQHFGLLTATIAVDMGNLFFKTDDYVQSEFWYGKARDLFHKLGNPNGKILVESNLVEISKVKGRWNDAENYLGATLKYDREKKLVAAQAIDFYNISHLEYLRRNHVQALEFVEKSQQLFERKKNLTGIIECQFLKIYARQFLGFSDPDLSILEHNAGLLSHDQHIILSFFRQLKNQPSAGDGLALTEHIKKIKSPRARFDLWVLFIQRFGMHAYLNELKILSMELSQRTKNYFYYEYYWVFFNFFNAREEIEDNLKEIFIETYYFFLRNGRRPTPGISAFKKKLDERDSIYDFLNSPELLGASFNWKEPEDFFKSFLNELSKKIKLNMVKLMIYENKQPLFSFSNLKGYEKLSAEVIRRALNAVEPFNLGPEDIRNCFQDPEKVFYPYKNTKVILWNISETLRGVLLLGFNQENYFNTDIHENYRSLFLKFASLIERFYEHDFKINQKLEFIVGESEAIKQLKNQISKVSRVDFSLLITGESGSGKELVAKGVHLLSSRSKNPFIPVNSAAIPENLLEAELFGYKKGAFTGANESRTGLIESAHNGTLFLDEIADIPVHLQAKLLRVLQEKEIRRLGENISRKVDIRLISATNRDLKELIKQNRFREDLFFRIQDISLKVPSLKERIKDIALLTSHFLEKYGFSLNNDSELRRIIAYFKTLDWKGNVRELESRVKRLITFYPDFEDEKKYLSRSDSGLKAVRAEFEKAYVLEKLVENRWNKVKTAKQLKISRAYLFDLIKKYHINPSG